MSQNIIFEPLNSDSVVSFFENTCKDKKIFILVDDNTLEHCLPNLLANVSAVKNAEIICIDADENQKELEICHQLWTTLSEYNAKRNDIFINLGGGVISDLGGFVASTFKRGMQFINIPTTLLSMVDAAIGGKNGINFNGHKNHIGTFNTPFQTIIDISFLETLPEKELLSGFAEMLKHGLIADASHFEKLIQLKKLEKISIELIQTSAEIKSKIVTQDYKETGLRKSLNYGHTIGHALESYSYEINKPLPHGYAIAYGMIIENQIAAALDIIDKKEAEEINSHIAGFYPNFDVEYLNEDYILSQIQNDKKNKSKATLFSFISEVGKTILLEIDIEKVAVILKQIK